MTLDDAIKEMREHREWKERRDYQERINLSAVRRILGLVTEDQIRSWRLIESLISGVSKETEPSADCCEVRLGLLAKEDVNNAES